MAGKPKDLQLRLDKFTHKDINGCWLWLGERKHGYGYLAIAGKKVRVHRLMYTRLVGTIPPGLVLDHICRVRHCVNPAHLRVCTNRENLFADGSQSITKLRHDARRMAGV